MPSTSKNNEVTFDNISLIKYNIFKSTALMVLIYHKNIFLLRYMHYINTNRNILHFIPLCKKSLCVNKKRNLIHSILLLYLAFSPEPEAVYPIKRLCLSSSFIQIECVMV